MNENIVELLERVAKEKPHMKEIADAYINHVKELEVKLKTAEEHASYMVQRYQALKHNFENVKLENLQTENDKLKTALKEIVRIGTTEFVAQRPMVAVAYEALDLRWNGNPKVSNETP